MENYSTDSITCPISVEYEQFEKTFPTLLSSTNRAVDVLLSGLTTTKGKFIRPILVFLTSKSLTPKIPRSVYHLASAVELLHQGSLLHDDVIDESERRRGEPSANKLFGNKKAILLGDLIVSRSLLEIVLSQSLDCVNSISRLIETLAEGEIDQLDTLNDDVLSEELYFDIISKKTASLFSLSARLSAKLSGASQADVDSFAQFGHIVGLCFQIRDDIFDYYDSPVTGKPAGNDLKEGKFTLPSIYAINNSSRDWSRHINDIRALTATHEQIKEVTEFTFFNGGITYAEKKMKEFENKAMSLLPASISDEFRDTFRAYFDIIVNRQR